MSGKHWPFIVIVIVMAGLFLVFSGARPTTQAGPSPTPTAAVSVATDEQLAQAHTEWAQSAHADTYDDGKGANTTCARCKSPRNWDPSQSLAAQQALDCGACKRVPGAPRPELPAGVPVPQAEWENITCDVCHIPVDDSYSTSVAFWNQALGQYEEVHEVAELCAKCHEGRHGFSVVEEQAVSKAHQGWECTRCHGDHGSPSACTDCHDPTQGPGASEHDRHTSVNCTGCHDAGGLSIWKDPDSGSPHYGEYITRRFAHTLTSWPSHNLSSEVDCERCHHPEENRKAVIVPYVGCDECHQHEHGAVLEWCIFFPRDPNPNAPQSDEP